MTFATCYGYAQLGIGCLCGRNTLFSQQCHSLISIQTIDRIFLYIGWHKSVGTMRPGTTGQQNATCAWLAIDDVEPLPNTWAVWKSLPCLPVKQVLKLV